MSQATTWGVPAAAPATPLTMATRMNAALDALLSSQRAATRPTYAVAGTVWVDSDTEILYYYDGTNDLAIMKLDSSGDLTVPGQFILPSPTAPATATATGVAGTIAWDASFVYVCVATDTWVRAALATW